MTQLISIDNADPTIADASDIALLGFKMAVNEGLTVFNLVDGVVDEFHDESGNDESESSNDRYNCSSDYYINSTQPDGVAICASYSAGFTTSATTEGDTSVTSANPAHGTTTHGTFTVPTGMTAMSWKLWGGGGAGMGWNEIADGGGGGYAEGVLAVTATQVIGVAVGEGSQSVFETGEGGAGFKGGGGNTAEGPISGCGARGSGGGGASGLYAQPEAPSLPQITAPDMYGVAGAGGGSGYINPGWPTPGTSGGAGGGLIGCAGATSPMSATAGTEQASTNGASGGGGSQTAGGQSGSSVNPPPDGEPGGFGTGGAAAGGQDPNSGAGGEGYYGGGGGGNRNPNGPSDARTGGGGSSYYGHPQVTSGSTEEGAGYEGGGTADPQYVAATNEGTGGGGIPTSNGTPGEDGYVLITGCASAPATATTTNVISNAFTAAAAPSTARIVVFQENLATPTLNTDIIASISRDGGSNFTTATLSDSGYVTGSSGQRILTGTATVSGQPSGTAMRWKLALANNTVKIHGVSLQWK